MRNYHVKWKGRMWAEMLLAEWFRGSPAPWRVLLSSYWVLQDGVNTHDPFVALSATAKGVPVVCGAEDMFSRGAVMWTVGWVPKSTPASAWDSWLRTCGRDSTADCLLGSCLMPFFQVGFKVLFLLPSRSFLCMWNKLLEPSVFSFMSPVWPVVPTALSTCVPWGSVGDTAMMNVNNSNSCFPVCLTSKTSSVLCQRQWWAVLSFPVLSVLGFGPVPVIVPWGARSGRARRVSLLKVTVGTAVLNFHNPEGRDCPSTVTLLEASLMLLPGWMAVFCRSWSGKRHSLDRVAGSSGGGTAGSSFVILSFCW